MPLSTGEKTLDVEYAEQMRCHTLGTALCHPQPHDIFHPGMVGYFDTYGNWNPITDLSQKLPPPPSSSASEPSSTALFTPPDDLPALAAPEQHAWGPKLGTTTHSRRIDLQAGVSEALMLGTTGVPLSLGSCFRFESEKSAGAVLITSAPIMHERFYHETPFKRWVVANAGRLLAERAELKKHALWVVTSTWAAEEVAVNCWRDRKRAVDVGFKIGFVEIGEIAPKGEWVDSGSAEGWMRVKGDAGLGSQAKHTTLRGKQEEEEEEKEAVVASLQAEDGMEYALSCEAVLEKDEAQRTRGNDGRREEQIVDPDDQDESQDDDEYEDVW